MKKVKLSNSDNIGEQVDTFMEYLNDSGYSKKVQHALTKIIMGTFCIIKRNSKDEVDFTIFEKVENQLSKITVSANPCPTLEKINKYYDEYSKGSQDSRDKLYKRLLTNSESMLNENDFDAYEIAVKANAIKPTVFSIESNNEGTVINLTFSLN